MYRQQQLDNLLANRRILIAGYGREGKSTHALIGQYVPSAKVAVAANDEEIRDCLDKAQGHPYDLIVKSPGIPTMKLEGRCNLDTVTSQTDLFLQMYGDQTVAVTGTKGKSTTTALIRHVLDTAFGSTRQVIMAGNMGIPLFDILPQIESKTLVVAEFSCHQLENMHRAPHLGIILTLYHEHLDHYHDYRDYQMAKMQMMLKQQTDDHCFYCTDSPDLALLTEELKPRIHSTLHPYSLLDAKQSPVAGMVSPLQGSHNLSNTYAAWQCTSLMGVTQKQFAHALSTFHGLPHRLQKVGTYQGITFYNDSISTIPEATIAAVETLQQVDTLIVGGFDRGIDYSALEHYIAFPTQAGKQIHNIVFVGNAGKRLYDTLANMPHRPLSRMSATLIENNYPKIVDWCFTHTQPGKICLLSPAAASYDNFKNFEERGDTYSNLIRSHK